MLKERGTKIKATIWISIENESFWVNLENKSGWVNMIIEALKEQTKKEYEYGEYEGKDTETEIQDI